jgi:DNA-binding transcriptional LysR family regulator
MDRLQSMRVLLRVVDEGNFAAAARALDISPAGVTRLVNDLETHLSVRLLQRTTRRLALTDAGEAYVARIRPLLNEMEELELGLSQHTTRVQGQLKICSSTVLAYNILGPLLPAFRLRYPEVTIDVYAETQASLRVEDYDVTLLIGDEDFNADIVGRPISTSAVRLFASPAYLKPFAPLRKVEDLAQHALLKQHRPEGTRHWTLTYAPPGAVKTAANRSEANQSAHSAVHSAVRNTQRAAIQTNHIETLLKLAVEGAGIAAMSDILVAPHVNSGALMPVLPNWRTAVITIYAALPSRKFVPAHAKAFLEFLQSYYPAMSARRARSTSKT